MTVVERAEAAPRGRRRRAVALVAASGLLAAAGWWLTHPQELGPQGDVLGGPENRFSHLVLEIVPRQAGEVVVDGLDISYSTGLRRGSQASALTVEVRAEG